MEENKLLNIIRAKNNLKTIFSYTDYNFILRLIKYNKSFQNKLGISLQNYIDYTSCKYLINTHKVYPFEIKRFFEREEIFFFFVILFNIILYGLFLTKIKILYYISFILEVLLLEFVIKNNQNLKIYFNIIEKKGLIINYILSFFLSIGLPKILIYIINKEYNEFNENSLKIIKYVNLNIILFFIFNVTYTLFLINHHKIEKYLKLEIFFSIIYILFDCLYELVTIWKIYLLFKLKEYDKSYFLFDFCFIFYNHYSIFLKSKLLIFFINIFKAFGKSNYYLVEYKNIKINTYILPDNYEKIKNKRKYLLSKAKDFVIEHSEKELEIFALINEFRVKNKVNKFILDKKIPDFIINEISEIILDDCKNIFKLEKEKYLFKYEKGGFQYHIKENEDILKKKNLNIINIIIKKDIEYIIIYEI